MTNWRQTMICRNLLNAQKPSFVADFIELLRNRIPSEFAKFHTFFECLKPLLTVIPTCRTNNAVLSLGRFGKIREINKLIECDVGRSVGQSWKWVSGSMRRQ